MANMGYCRFINTLDDLLDCEEHMDDEDLSAAEAKAQKRLIQICQRIGADYSDILDDSD